MGSGSRAATPHFDDLFNVTVCTKKSKFTSKIFRLIDWIQLWEACGAMQSVSICRHITHTSEMEYACTISAGIALDPDIGILML